jgi:hypothetical protein
MPCSIPKALPILIIKSKNYEDTIKDNDSLAFSPSYPSPIESDRLLDLSEREVEQLSPKSKSEHERATRAFNHLHQKN